LPGLCVGSYPEFDRDVGVGEGSGVKVGVHVGGRDWGGTGVAVSKIAVGGGEATTGLGSVP